MIRENKYKNLLLPGRSGDRLESIELLTGEIGPCKVQGSCDESRIELGDTRE